MGTKCPSAASPVALCPIPRYSRRSPAKRVRREEEEQGNERSFRRQAETEWSGLCDDEPPWAKSLAARRRRNFPAKRAIQRPDEGIGSYKKAFYHRPLIRPFGPPSPRGEGFFGGIISSSVQPSASHLPPRGKALWGMAPSSSQVEGLKGRRNPPKFTFSVSGGGAPAPPPGRRTSCPPGTAPGRPGR